VGIATQSPLRTHSKEYDNPGRGKSMRHKTRVYRLLASPRGQTMAEYALILATIALVVTALYDSAGTIVTELVHGVSVLL